MLVRQAIVGPLPFAIVGLACTWGNKGGLQITTPLSPRIMDKQASNNSTSHLRFGPSPGPGSSPSPDPKLWAWVALVVAFSSPRVGGPLVI